MNSLTYFLNTFSFIKQIILNWFEIAGAIFILILCLSILTKGR